MKMSRFQLLLFLSFFTTLSLELFSQVKSVESWSIEYNWYWISGQNIGSNLIEDIEYHNDSFFLLLPSQALVSTDGRNWEEVESGYGYAVVRGLTHLNDKLYFVSAFTGQLKSRSGKLVTDWRIVTYGDNWQVFEDSDSTRTFMINDGDTSSIDRFVSHVHQVDSNLFFCIPRNISKNCFIYNFKTSESREIPFRLNSQSFEIEHIGNHVYILDEGRITFLYLSEKGEVLAHSTEEVEQESRLARFDNVIAQRSRNGLRLLHDSISETDLAAFKHLDISRIIRLQDKIFAISSTRGLAYLEPTGVNINWTPPTVNDQVDGLLQLDGSTYVYNWASQLGEQITQNGALNSRFIGKSTIRFRGVDLVLTPYLHVPQGSLIPTEEYSRLFPRINPDPEIPKRLIAARVTLIEEESDSTLFMVKDKHAIHRVTVRQDDSVEVDVAYKPEAGHGVEAFARLENAPSNIHYWLAEEERFFLVDEDLKPVQELPIPRVRSVIAMGDDLLVASYGSGLFRVHEGEVHQIVYNNSRGNQYCSEIGFQHGSLFLLTNEGIFLQDSAFAVTTLHENKPLFLYPVFNESKIEVNGSLFRASLKTSDSTRIIASTAGVLEITFPNKIDVTTHIAGGENPSDSVLAFPGIDEIAPSSSSAFFAWNEKTNSWQELSSLELIQRRPSKVIMAFSPPGNVVNYFEYYQKPPFIPPFVYYLALILLSVAVVILIRRQRQVDRSRTLQRLSLNSGWKPIKHNREDLHFKSIIQLIHHDFKGGMQMLLNILSFAKKANETRQAELIENAEGMIVNFRQSLSDRLSNALYNDDYIYMDIESVIDSAMNEVREYALLKKIKLDVSSNVILKVKHSDELIRATSICLGNAVKFSQNGQTVTLRTYVTKAYLVIEIIDNGIGLPKTIIDGLPEQQRGANGEVGMGVALGIVTKLLSKYDAQLTVENRVDSSGAIAQIAYPLSNTDYEPTKNSKASDN